MYFPDEGKKTKSTKKLSNLYWFELNLQFEPALFSDKVTLLIFRIVKKANVNYSKREQPGSAHCGHREKLQYL